MKPFPFWQDYPIQLTDANSVVTLDLHGEWLACYSANEEFSLTLAGVSTILFNQGLRCGWGDGRSVQVTVRPKPGATVFPNRIILRPGSGEYADARFSVSAPLQIASGAVIQARGAATLDAGIADIALVANTNTQLVASNANRFRVRVLNTSTTQSVRLSSVPADLTAGRGYILGPGEQVALELTGELHARAAAAATLNVTQTLY